jgi:predicted ATP-grasp superfamily ATP-dependent carboligase
MSNLPAPILLVSLTARMLAELAVNAGYSVLALDYFGDADLQALCPNLSLRWDFRQTYSATALVDAAVKQEAPAVVYGASLENHPVEVARLARGRHLLGNSPDTLTQVRDPLRLADALQAGGFVCPQTVLAEPGLTLDQQRSWLWKPLKSGGGHGIHVWQSGAAPPPEGVWQEYLSGMAGSAVFVANGQRAVLLGLTEQLVGRRAFGARSFGYCGNLLPPRLTPGELNTLLREMKALLAHLTKTFELWGLNGLDFIWHRGRGWTVEVNPRPSASLELVDFVYGLRVFDLHVRSFKGELPDFDLEQAINSNRAAGKAILFAPHDVRPGDTARWARQGIRDIPHPGEQIKQHHPVCTLLSWGATPLACLRQLRSKALKLKQELNSVDPILPAEAAACATPPQI